MSLLKRVARAQQRADAPNAEALDPVQPPAPQSRARVAAREELLHDIRLRLQNEVMSAFDSLLDIAEPKDLERKLAVIVDRIIAAHGFAVTGDERSRLIGELVGEVGGLGPLDPLLADETITEIMVNGPSHVYIERRGKIERVDSHFLNNEHVLRIIDRIITPLGRRIDASSPRVDARLPDGSRVNAVIEPLSLVGPVITIRKFSAKPFTVDDLIGFGTATAEMFEFIRVCVEARLNVFVSGGTG
ncbi:MAG: CpaF family protein, partial [Chloroflexi bacterium]|nr:CpaF family protein [Chloroflexota bacterium]